MPATIAVFPSEGRRLRNRATGDDIELLHAISMELIAEQDSGALYGRIVDAAVTITGSQFGTMQVLCPREHPSGRGGELQLLASRGLSPEALAFWGWVKLTAYSSCTLALKLGQRAIIPDFEAWPDIAGTEDLLAFRGAGIRSAQTTPLVSRDGALLGMISTHWSEPHQPSARDLRLLDILARQAADLLERTMAEEARRERALELDRTCAALRASEESQRRTEADLRRLNETLEARVRARTDELMAAEGQMRQMQKLEAIGQLTGGVAHDFNNLLTIIRSSVDFLRRPDLPDERRGRYMDAVSETVDRAAKLTGQLLAFARRQALKPETFEVGERLRSVADMLDTVTGARIRVLAEIPGEPCFVTADLSQFETALVNMGVNGRDAMGSEGTLTLRLLRASALPPIRGHAGATGPFAAVSLTDTGSGIAPEDLTRIFEPFFTTKEVGKGTGLGLSQVFGFAQQSGGDVDVTSVLGQGTTFTLYLPEVDGATGREAAPGRHDAALPAGEGRRVLVVEDNLEVGRFAVQILEDFGYRTTLATNAEDALDKLAHEGADFDAVFSDVVMPGMGGIELAKHLRHHLPGLPVLLTSGYSHVLARDGAHGFKLLHKPYSADQLQRVLGGMLPRRVAKPV